MTTEASTPNLMKSLNNRYQTPIALIFIILATLVAYSNSFKGVLVFDDIESIEQNASIRHLTTALFPPHQSGITVEGRPILNLSLAINYAISGINVWSYHLTNLFIHLGCACLLFGIIRASLDYFSNKNALRIATYTTLIWAVHPLTTESVTYIIQRAESLMGFFYLLSLYCFIKYKTNGPKNYIFACLSVIACFLGMGTKEVMVSAPIIILCYDYLVFSGTFKKTIQESKLLYIGLATSWIVLLCILATGENRGGTVQLNSLEASYTYLLTQCYAVTHYIKLVFLPSPLIFYYGRDTITHLNAVLLPAICLILCISSIVWAFTKKYRLSLLGLIFFAVLAPSSSFIPVITETIAEHRMYLPLIPCILIIVLVIDRYLSDKISWLILSVICCLLIYTTYNRNTIYASPVKVWKDTVAKLPTNPWAHFYTGWYLEHSGDRDGATKEYKQTIALKPDFAEAYNNLGKLAAEDRLYTDALKYFQNAIQYKSDYTEAHTNLGELYATLDNHIEDAIHEFDIALKIDPHFPEANNGYALVLETIHGREREAAEHFIDAIKYRSNYAAAHNNLANLYARYSDKQEDALIHYKAAVSLDPNNPAFHLNLANLLSRTDNTTSQAISEYRIALSLDSSNAEAHGNLGLLLSNTTATQKEAIDHYRIALRLKPNSAQLHNNLANILATLPDHQNEAIEEYTLTLSLLPNYPEAHNNFAQLLATIEGKQSQARSEFIKAIELMPNSIVIHLNYARFLESQPGYQLQAAQEYKSALELDPQCSPAKAGLQRLGFN